MRNSLLTGFILITFVSFVFPQNYKLVDSIVRNYPQKFTNPDDLVLLINRNFRLQEEKARAIYTWLALNIEYDIQAIAKPCGLDSLKIVEELNKRKEGQFKEGIIPYTLRKGNGTCINYAILYKYFCDHVSLECEIVFGMGKNGILNYDSIPYHSNHSWNAVRVGKEWKLIDVTWASGYYDENSGKVVHEFNDFFFSHPQDYLQTAISLMILNGCLQTKPKKNLIKHLFITITTI